LTAIFDYYHRKCLRQQAELGDSPADGIPCSGKEVRLTPVPGAILNSKCGPWANFERAFAIWEACAMIRFDYHKYSGISTPPRFSPVGYGVNEQFASFRLTCL